MKMFNTLRISSTGMTAERLRMDTISSNIANATTTRTDQDGQPYRRKIASFKENMEVEISKYQGNDGKIKTKKTVESQGVVAAGIYEDDTPLRRVYEPGNPDADEDGYVLMPNVNILNEMVDMIASTRAYEANVTAFNAGKSMFMRALEIGKG